MQPTSNSNLLHFSALNFSSVNAITPDVTSPTPNPSWITIFYPLFFRKQRRINRKG